MGHLEITVKDLSLLMRFSDSSEVRMDRVVYVSPSKIACAY